MPATEFYSVYELTKMVRNVIDREEAFRDVWVKGEISNFNHHSRGHMYFTLKDAQSKVKSVMFAGANRLLQFQPENGMTVLVRGNVSVYERDGQYQLYVEEMQPDGVGSLFLAFEQLKKKLQDEGLFAQEKKKDLPVYPRVVGVVTSAAGAAIRDILTTIKRRYPVVRILLIPVAVQGERAVPSIVEAIEVFNQKMEADLLIVGRGGGSMEELWAFNEEAVARSIYASQIPVISAVGHETDTTIADFVADVRAATPTAAAELAVPNLAELLRHTEQLTLRLKQALQQDLAMARSCLERLQSSSIFKRPEELVGPEEQRLDHLMDRLRHSLERVWMRQKETQQSLLHRLSKEHPQNQWRQAAVQFEYAGEQLKKAMSSSMERRQNHCHLLVKQLDALSPLKVMQRGYSVVRTGAEVVDSIDKVELGDIVQVQLQDGALDCQVYGIQPHAGGELGDEREDNRRGDQDKGSGTIAI